MQDEAHKISMHVESLQEWHISRNQNHELDINFMSYQWCFLVLIVNLTEHAWHSSLSDQAGSFDNMSVKDKNMKHVI